jgi:LmbE family N-acetylglucosaminyl deacetylase
MNILAIGSHPDDLEGGCYATLKRYYECGSELFYVIASLGEDAGNPEIRRKESLKAAETVEAKVLFGQLPSAHLADNSGRETIVLIEKAIKDFRPDIIFTHTYHDRHQDHRLVNKATESACRFYKGDIYYYEGFSSLKTFNPDTFYLIDDFFQKKLEVLSYFESQNKKPYMDKKVIETLARFRACQANLWGGLAEAFETGRVIK